MMNRTSRAQQKLPMLTTLFLLVLTGAFVRPTNAPAQWTTNGNNINNTNTGNVGIGTSSPAYPLQISKDSSGELWLLSILDSTAKTWTGTVRDGILFEGRFTGQSSNWQVAN
ncbi:MAG TPA: hypothetical protein VEQ40_09115, partial [Pyrinomonadaceae bacterium]|nr:hypothetical protein [Pyrinomonadaceae bacterium]